MTFNPIKGAWEALGAFSLAMIFGHHWDMPGTWMQYPFFAVAGLNFLVFTFIPSSK